MVTDVPAKKLGGRVLLEPSAEVAQGRVAVIEDPAGVDFFVYQIDEGTR